MRYYTNGGGEYFSTHCLLSDKEILNISSNNPMPIDMFASVQSYDINGVEQFSQLVFDIDCKDDISHAFDIAKSIYDDVSYEYDTECNLYFSGSKGFHVVTPLAYRSKLSNVAMKKVAFDISDEIDPAMYKSRSMFRLNNTINSKTGLYKRMVDYDQSIDDIIKNKMYGLKSKFSSLEFDNKTFNDNVSAEIKRLESRKTFQAVIVKTDWESVLSPCVAFLINSCPVGHRFDLCFYLVRHWRLCGVTAEEAVALSLSFPIFKEANYTPSMVRHYYNNELLNVGCESGALSSIMKQNCVSTCRHNTEWVDGFARNVK